MVAKRTGSVLEDTEGIIVAGIAVEDITDDGIIVDDSMPGGHMVDDVGKAKSSTKSEFGGASNKSLKNGEMCIVVIVL